MKIKTILTIIIVLSISFSYAQNAKKVKDAQSDKEIIIGKCSYDEIVKEIPDYHSQATAYRPNDQVMDGLKYKLDNYTFTIVFGGWCEDSKTQVPKFMKLLMYLKYDINKVNYVRVDRDKKAGTYDISNLKIEKVPTFIIYKDGKEAGRIIESPTTTMEKHFSKILLGK